MVTTIPGVGTVTRDGDCLVSEPRYVPALDKQCRFVIDGYEPEESAGLVTCMAAFSSLSKADLDVAAEAVFAYYRDVEAEVGTEPGFPRISGPANLWNFVTFARRCVARTRRVNLVRGARERMCAGTGARPNVGPSGWASGNQGQSVRRPPDQPARVCG